MASANSLYSSFGTPKRKLAQGNLVVTSTSQSAVFNPQTKSDSFPSDVRPAGGGEVPHSVQRSIYGFTTEKEEPLSELDLSDDSQADITERAKVEQAKEQSQSVVVFDALTQRLAEGVTEVAVTESVELSPHKVVCHSPRAAQLSLRNSGDTHKAANVHVDLMHSVTIKNSSPEQIRDNSLIRKSSENESSLSSAGAPLGDEEPATLQDISDELKHSKTKSSSKEYTSLKKKKKKTGRVVASRLMETTIAHKAKSIGQSQHESQRSTLQQSSTSRRPRYLNDQSNVQKIKPSAYKTGATTPATHASKTKRPVSTPELVAPDESFDVSALQGTGVGGWQLNYTDASIALPPSTLPEKSVPATKMRPKTVKKKTLTSQITQDSIDVCYARYLQWLFLSSKAAKAIESEENQVMPELQRLWTENQKMKQKLSSLDQEYDRLQHTTNLDEMLDLQKSQLGPIVNELPQLSKQYQSLAVALDTTRHELFTEGVNIPDNEKEQKEFEDAMISALDESEQLLAEISSHTRRDVTTTSQYAQSIDSLSKCALDDQKELHRCKELVTSAQKLTNYENSMKIGEKELSGASAINL